MRSSDAGAPPADQLTPAMRQYWEQKERAGDAILLFRMGDFYEMFYEDAEIGAKLLGIALTSRDNGRTPLAGIPHHALESYLSKLVSAGKKVAISEQIEDAKQAKGIVRRAIVRIVTPGTLTDAALLDRARANLLAAVCVGGGQAGVALLELSTGEFLVFLCDERRLVDELCRAGPAEVLLSDSGRVGRYALEQEISERVGAAVAYRPGADFGEHRALSVLTEHFQTQGLEGFGFDEMDPSLQAAGALLVYVQETQVSAVSHLRPPRRQSMRMFMELDPTTLRSLEIERTLRTGSRAGSLLAAVDATCSPMGARLLRDWLCYPLRDVAGIQARQDWVELLCAADAPRRTLRTILNDMGDIGRVVGRIGVQRTHPRDLRALANGLKTFETVREALGLVGHPRVLEFADRLSGLDDLAATLDAALLADAPTTVRDGGIFKDGYDGELDRLRQIGSAGQAWLQRFQLQESERTGISTLKVGFNKVFGYYIEVTHPHRDRVPAEYVRKQTVKNAERYITDELKHYESEALSAESKAKELEYELFAALREEVSRFIPQLQRAAEALAEIDVLAGWAELARHGKFCRPEFIDEPALEIADGRHPVVERTHAAQFVPNDTRLAAGGASLGLITGPNMAGKSTYIRQVALLTLLAHCGCFVPAQRMRLGVVDRIFTRVGASDELSRGQSTFMVEMLETANILHNASRESLVILDEVGRGTSTFDGLALAWAITEHLAVQCGCRTLFATHYHEMTELAELLDPVFNLNVAVQESEEEVVFLHRIVPGATGRSYGLHVARLAGIPREALERANAVLTELERTFQRESQRPALAAMQRRRKRQLRLFEEPEEAVVRELRELADGAPTADEALDLIQRWRGLLGLEVHPGAESRA